MSVVLIEGQFLGAGMNTRKFNDGNEKNEVLIDVYQPDSPLVNKNLRISSDDLTAINQFQAYKMGDTVRLRCSVRGYKDAVYYKLLEKGILSQGSQKLAEVK